ncbi:hydrogenase expression/formation protein HypE [Haloimpatiens sp. FM7330]|uniref:hydrogenase expression/formation protein HypE n=1 Tax=Haloimpatiens sp. FM7330 TaxID=3298610 RepID=UPI00362A6178
MEEIISMSYGNGGKKTSKLINELIVPKLKNDELKKLGDGALLNISNEIAFSTDSFVIYPYFFPGGDIGKLSVCGTVNDLLMCGSIPKYLSLSFILEEGFKIKELEVIINSIQKVAKKIGVKVVTGDTKVVDKGHGHGIYINTAGIGERIKGLQLGKHKIEIGDKIIVSGSVGNHGISILCKRENLLEQNILSDCAPLIDLIDILQEYKDDIKILRDPTRGGVATTLNEFVEDMKFSIELKEDKIPIDSDVKMAANLLGLDPLYSANEGKALIVVSRDACDELLEKLKEKQIFQNSEIIGEVVDYVESKVILEGKLGGKRILDKLSYDILPRIC